MSDLQMNVDFFEIISFIIHALKYQLIERIYEKSTFNKGANIDNDGYYVSFFALSLNTQTFASRESRSSRQVSFSNSPVKKKKKNALLSVLPS
jgi:hypothetical protein